MKNMTPPPLNFSLERQQKVTFGPFWVSFVTLFKSLKLRPRKGVGFFIRKETPTNPRHRLLKYNPFHFFAHPSLLNEEEKLWCVHNVRFGTLVVISFKEMSSSPTPPPTHLPTHAPTHPKRTGPTSQYWFELSFCHGHDMTDANNVMTMDNLVFNSGIWGTGMTRSLMRRKKRRGGKRKKAKMMP